MLLPTDLSILLYLAIAARRSFAADQRLFARDNATTTTGSGSSAGSTSTSTSTHIEVITVLPASQASSGSSSTSTSTHFETITVVPSNQTSSSNSGSSSSANLKTTSAVNGSWASVTLCNIASLNFSSAHMTSSLYNRTQTYVSTLSTISMVGNVSTYTLCDGYPRANIPDPTQTYTSSYVSDFPVTSTYMDPTITDPPPMCTIAPSDCTQLWSNYLNASSTHTGPFSIHPPACPTPAAVLSEYGTSYCSLSLVFDTPDEPPCQFEANPVRLVYFPVDVVPNNLTARLCSNYTTATPTATTPVTVETLGTTFTSGTAYISFEKLLATDRCGGTVGSVMSNFFLPVKSSEVSSLCGEFGAPDLGALPTSLNFADLLSPVPLSAYSCAPRCLFGVHDHWQAECPTVYNDYAPALGFPTKVTALQSKWKSCGYMQFEERNEDLLWDPPIALKPADTPASITLPGNAPTTTADTAHTTTSVPTPTDPPQQSSSLPEKSSSPPEQSSNPPQQSSAPPQQSSPQPANPQSDQLPSSAQQQPTNNGDPGTTPAPAAPQPANSAGSPTVSNQQPANSPDNGAPANSPANSPQQGGNTPAQQTRAQQPAAVATIGNVPLTPASNGNGGVVVSPATLAPGQTTQIDGTAVSIGPSNVVIGGTSTVPLAADPGAGNAPVATVGGVTLSQAGTQGGVVVGPSTLTDGQTAVIQGTPVSVGGNSVVVGGTAIPLTGSALADPISQGAVPIAASRAGSNVVIEGTTLTPGQVATINGQQVTELPDGSGVAVGGSTVAIPDGAQITVPPSNSAIAALGISQSGANYIVGGTTLTPGQVATINGMTVSELSNGNGVAIGSSTVSLASGAQATVPVAGAGAGAGDATASISRSGSNYIVDGTALTAGQTAVIDGQAMTDLPNGGGLVIGGTRTISIADGSTTALALGPTSLFSEGLVTAGSRTITAYGISGQTGQAVVDGTTLRVGGPAATISGQTLSLSPSGLVNIGNGKTTTIGGVGVTTPSPAGGSTRPTASSTAPLAKSAGEKMQIPRWMMMLAAVVAVAML